MGEDATGQKSSTRRSRMLVLIVLGIALVAGVPGFNYLWLSRPVGSGPAGPAVAREAFSKPWTTREVLLLGIGDSVTAGFGSTRGHSYFARLVSNPPDEFDDLKGLCLSAVLPNLKTRNLAVSGSTSLQHVRVVEKLEPNPPDVLGLVVMTTGGNDLIHDYGRTPPREGAMFGATLAQARPWINAFEHRLNTMINRIETCFPGGCHIFLADIYDPTDGVGDTARAGLPPWPDVLAIHREYNDILARCARDRKSVHPVKMHDAFLGHGIHCTQFWREHYRRDDPHYWYYYNLEDPNDRGYDAIRRLFLIEMARTLGIN